MKHAEQRGIWVPTQHLLWDQGKPWETLIELAGRRTFRIKLTSSQQSGNEHANPSVSPWLCSCFIEVYMHTIFTVFLYVFG
jgi:hypothetical protein